MNPSAPENVKPLDTRASATGFWNGTRKAPLFLCLCLLATVLFGLYRIGHYSLWLDEYTTLRVTRNLDILFAFLNNFPEQHPLYYLLIKGLHINNTLLEIRYFSLICGVLSILPLYYIGSRVFSPKIALTACLFSALSPFMLYYNQEGRMYSLFVLLVLVQTSCLVWWAVDGSRWAKYGVAVFSILSIYTHFFSSFLLICEFLWLLALQFGNMKIRIRFREALAVFAVVGLAYTPWLFHILANLGGMAQKWRGIYNIAFAVPYTFFRFGAGYGIFPLHYQVKLHLSDFYLSGLIWGVIFCLAYLPAALLVAKRVRRTTAVQSLIFTIAFLPIVLVVIGSLFKNIASERYVIFSAPFFYLIIASAKAPDTPRKNLLQMAALGLPMVLLLAGVGYYYFNPQFGKTNYRAAAALILAQGRGSDRVVCRPPQAAGPIEYYLKDKMTVSPYRAWQAHESDSGVWMVERIVNTPEPVSLAGLQFEKVIRKIFPQENGLRVTYWRRLPAGKENTP